MAKRDLTMMQPYCDLLETLRQEVYGILCNKLILPKTILQVPNHNAIPSEHWGQAAQCIDESIKLVDAKFIEALDQLHNPQ